uniref:ShKT domain-containing protein n=1 Tax=Panagrolaimus davidi TaxID=227884 RepID=A0A914P3M4_9BILA
MHSIIACIDNSCPTGYTCNTGTQLCCSSTSVTTSTTCRDLIGPKGYSDCPARASLCNSTVYYTLMTQQCPRTCGRCSITGSSTVSPTCVDLTRANGTSDCPQLAYLCNNTAYSTLMTQQCPRTCGRCSSG